MDFSLGSFGVWRRQTEVTPAMAQEAETLGYGALWVGGSPPGDLEAIERIIAATERIPVLTGVVNMWREDAELVATSYHRIQKRHPNRFILGVGIGHPESTEEFQKPIDKIVDYLDRLDRSGVPKDRLLLAALGPKVLRLAAERTRGAHPYLTTPRHTALARQVMGFGSLLAPTPMAVVAPASSPSPPEAKAIVARYLRLSNYRRNLLREGWDSSDLEAGGSTRLVDALVLHGPPETVAAGLTAHLEAGADHVAIYVLDDDPIDSWRQLAKVLI
ncbi:MAG TPA: TIGR03620 family F420-dependent LLM class oxidoreductase [Acidimicrobiia bacterium]|jgi:probable F420-dependent oxidoreductase